MAVYGSSTGPEYLDESDDTHGVGRRLRLRGRLQAWPMGEDDEAEHIKRCPDPQCGRCETVRAAIAADLEALA